MMKSHHAVSAALVALLMLLHPGAGAQPPAGAGAAADRAANQQAERAQRQAERAQSQAAERARERAERFRGNLDTLPEQAADQARENAQRGLDQAERAANPEADLPERLAVPGRNGSQAFVEITIEPGIRVLEREWVMLLTQPQREQLENEAADLMRFLTDTRPFDALDSYLLKFRVPPDLDTDDAIRELIPESLQDQIDRNHVYSAPAEAEEAGPAGRAHAGAQRDTDRLSLPMTTACRDELSLGMIDSGVKADHPAFTAEARSPSKLVSRDFLDEEIEAPLGHGTAVAGILQGRGPGLNPLLPGATIYAASAFYSRDAIHQGASVMALLEALDWLIAQDIGVINMSLAGPDNRLLEQGVNAARARGKVIVAAAGNHGPHAPPRYPAAYDGVVTATAVDRERVVYRWANQGEHIDFTALGVSIPTALGDGSFGHESGTSMATPVVSAFLACSLAEKGNNADLALSELKSTAIDLGEPGHDPVFGHGLLHPGSE